METMDIILDKVCDELEESAQKIAKQGKMSMAELKEIGELIDIKKNILKAEMLEDAGRYSHSPERYGDRYDDENSYARRGEHYVRGHYSRARDMRKGDRGRYSRSASEDELIEHIDMMMESAETPEQREIIKRFKKRLEEL